MLVECTCGAEQGKLITAHPSGHSVLCQTRLWTPEPTPSQKVATALKNFPVHTSRYVLVGSGPMAARNMRDAGDLDIFCTTEDWFWLVENENYKTTLTSGWDEKRRCDPPIASKTVEGMEINCFFDWRLRWGDMIVDTTAEIANAEFIVVKTSDGYPVEIPCMRLERLIAWKHSAGRPKDYADIAKIAAYLTRDEEA